MAGRPKPTALKVIEGNRGKRPLPKNEPKPAPKAPPCPKDIDAGAKRAWRRILPILEGVGLVTVADGDMLAILCQTRSRLEQIYRRLKKLPTLTKKIEKQLGELETGGLSKANLKKIEKLNERLAAIDAERAWLMKEERLYSQNFRMQAGEFGLSPRGRTGLAIKADEDDGESLLT